MRVLEELTPSKPNPDSQECSTPQELSSSVSNPVSHEASHARSISPPQPVQHSSADVENDPLAKALGDAVLALGKLTLPALLEKKRVDEQGIPFLLFF